MVRKQSRRLDHPGPGPGPGPVIRGLLNFGFLRNRYLLLNATTMLRVTDVQVSDGG